MWRQPLADELGGKEVLHGVRPGDVFVRRRLPRLRGLRRTLGVPGLFSSAYGNVGSSIYYALGVTALYALGLTPFVFIGSGIVFGFTALSYAEGTAAIPESGGSSSFARRAFNELWSFLAGWTLMLDYIITIAISAFSVPKYLAYFFPALAIWPTSSVVAIGVVVVLALVNVRGVKEATTVNVGLSVIDLMTQTVIAVMGVLFVINIGTLLSNIHLGIAPTWGQLAYGISISMIAYTGIETVSNLAEETKDPGRAIPRAVTLVFVVVLLIYSLISVMALSAMPVRQEPDGLWTTDLATTYLENPILGVASTLPGVLRPVMSAWVSVLAVSILIIATNAGILGLSRLAYSMGQHKQLLPVLAQIHPRYHTPHMAILVFSAVAILLIAPGSIHTLADLYSFGAMLAFTFAHASVIALRIKQPDLPRPFKIPFNVRIKGKDIPITAVIGGMATMGTWFVVVITHPIGRTVGFGWMIAGLVLYYIYRRTLKVSVFTTIEPPRHRGVS